MEPIVMQDTAWVFDTLRVSPDSFSVQRRVGEIVPRKVERETFFPEEHYGKLFREKVNPLAEMAAKSGWKVFAINTFQDNELAPSFREQIQASYPFYHADDKLLKTIIRSNPGLVILKDGAVVKNYHWRHFPTPEELMGKFK